MQCAAQTCNMCRTRHLSIRHKYLDEKGSAAVERCLMTVLITASGEAMRAIDNADPTVPTNDTYPNSAAPKVPSINSTPVMYICKLMCGDIV